MISITTIDTWTPRLMAHEFHQRVQLMRDMVGTLYPSIVRHECETITKACIAKYGHHPNHFAEIL